MAAGINSMQSFVMQIMLVLREAIGGYRFSPSDEELINFLKSENPGYREDFCIIPTIGNIYETNPWDLPEKFNENSMIPSNGREWWFICPHMQNQRNCRKTPSNYSWKITGKSTDIKIDGRKIGSKKIFVFPEGRGSKGSKSLWLIHEYRLPDENICKSGRNYVLCHLKPKQDELCRLQTDDAGSIPEHLIQATMESLRKSTQHQNRPQFSLPDLLQLFLHGQQSQNNSFRSNINQHEWVDTLSTENRFHAEVQKGEAPRLEKVQQETAARNIEPWISSNEATARAEHLNQATMESLRKSAQHQNGAQYSFPYLLQPFPCGPQSQNNSFHSNINQVTNIGSLPANDFSLDNGHTDKSIEFESLLGTTKEDRRVESLFPEDLFDAKVQKGEEPRLEKVQQETAVRNIGPGISSYEAEARAKNGQIFITANRQSIVEPLNCVFPPEERKGIPSNPFDSSGFSKFSEFEAYFDQPADQEKGLDHEEDNLAGNSPKRRRLDVSEENQIH
ncbi:hypothetical protein ACJRO7_027143 [Eucalyptus globulus]|uniref:NAC domain-containing protein n=1 Tax=Eucalyptus globulus TaxID=34317 RepID=A0ABD3JU02_EUCGL